MTISRRKKMSYKTKPQIKLYAFQNNAFVLQAIIDDFQEVSFERNLYQAGTFTISINSSADTSLYFILLFILFLLKTIEEST